MPDQNRFLTCACNVPPCFQFQGSSPIFPITNSYSMDVTIIIIIIQTHSLEPLRQDVSPLKYKGTLFHMENV